MLVHLRALASANKLVEGATNDIDRVRLLASSAKESGAWLHALPISALELKLDDDSMRIAIRLHLGTPLYAPHLNVSIVGQRLILLAGMGLVLGRVRGDITGMLPSMTLLIVP